MDRTTAFSSCSMKKVNKCLIKQPVYPANYINIIVIITVIIINTNQLLLSLQSQSISCTFFPLFEMTMGVLNK